VKLAISGKGGAGKTTVAVFLARYLAERGRQVILIDADPDANASLALGLPGAVQPVPIIELQELIRERTGSEDNAGQYFSLNPRVDDIPARYSVDAGGVKLLRMGALRKGGNGCLCPENAFIGSLLAHLVFAADEVVILDMQAGIEHLGRGTARGVDMMLVVVEPGRRSIQTAFSVARLAQDLGIPKLGVVLNKCRSPEELAQTAAEVASLPVVGRIPYDEAIAASDLAGVCPYQATEQQRRWVEEILSHVGD
jgi:CO dehydrogenase maturation factor